MPLLLVVVGFIKLDSGLGFTSGFVYPFWTKGTPHNLNYKTTFVELFLELLRGFQELVLVTLWRL